MIQTFDHVLHYLPEIFEIEQQACLVEFGARESDPNLVVMAVRVFALAFVIAQVMACRKCVFHRDFEHVPRRSAVNTGLPCALFANLYCSALVRALRFFTTEVTEGRSGIPPCSSVPPVVQEFPIWGHVT